MRVSEKTVEINFCAQFEYEVGQKAFWFGLTQEQEKKAGYDVVTKTPGRLLVLQFKASAHVLKSGERRFHAPHHQLVALQERLKGSRDILYVLPAFGISGELPALSFDIVSNSWLLNVADIGPIGPPTQKTGALRKNAQHYMDLDQVTGIVTIHSDPVEVRASRSGLFASEIRRLRTRDEVRALDQPQRSQTEPEKLQFESYRDFDTWTRSIGSKAMGCFIPE